MLRAVSLKLKLCDRSLELLEEGERGKIVASILKPEILNSIEAKLIY
jgi:hypothetical protein